MTDSQSEFLASCIQPEPSPEDLRRQAVELAYLVRCAIRIADDQGYLGLAQFMRNQLAQIEGAKACSNVR